MASRSRSKAEDAIADLKSETGKEAISLELDLASLDAVTKAAREFQAQETDLHVLFNSGGVLRTPVDDLTKDGYDMQFVLNPSTVEGVNALGHAHLTLLLLPQLLAGARSSSDGKARVVNVSSFAAYTAGAVGIYWDTLTDTPQRKKVDTAQLYAQSKYGNIVFSNELAKRFGDQGIVSTALHPGVLDTGINEHMPRRVIKTMEIFIMHPLVPYGALTSLYAGTAPEAGDLNGKWLIPWARVGKMGASKDAELGEKLWDWIEEQRKGHY
ncbi:hypothetical protein FRB97_007059 [Tulasnella sp. 331]|nr:hypothetical protein FRB97_007059 [Tulasnella sp. 331]